MGQQKKLIDSFESTRWLVSKFVEGLSHEDSVVAPPFRSNSFNWVLGHILVSRDNVIALLNQNEVLKSEERELYDTGSDILNPSHAVHLDKLVQLLEESQNQIAQGLNAATDQELAALFNEERGQTVEDRISGLHWHETYHLGQLEILRQVHRELDPFP